MSEEKQKPGINKWKCPECGQTLTLYIKPSADPTCSNPEKHPKKTVVMVSKTRGK
jgi:rubrerythrin